MRKISCSKWRCISAWGSMQYCMPCIYTWSRLPQPAYYYLQARLKYSVILSRRFCALACLSIIKISILRRISQGKWVIISVWPQLLLEILATLSTYTTTTLFMIIDLESHKCIAISPTLAHIIALSMAFFLSSIFFCTYFPYHFLSLALFSTSWLTSLVSCCFIALIIFLFLCSLISYYFENKTLLKLKLNWLLLQAAFSSGATFIEM